MIIKKIKIKFLIMTINKNHLLIFLIFFSFTNSTKLKEGDTISLIHVEYGYNKTKFELSVKNREVAEINDYLSSRIAFLNDSENDNIIFDLYSTYINKYWLFLVNTSEMANNLLLRDDYKQKGLYINGIIIPKRLQYSLPKNNNNEKIPIFELEDNITNYLFTQDIRTTHKNTYFLFDIHRVIGNYPEFYLLINALCGLVLGLGLLLYWVILIKKTRFLYVLSLHKFLYVIPFFIIILGFSLIIKAYDIRGRNPYQESDDSIFIDTILITLNACYRTILWFMILLICSGWKISVQTFRIEELKFFMKMLLIIYIIMCLDQMIDSGNMTLWVFHLSEIKNLIFYIFMLFLIFSKLRKVIFFLNRRLYYARTLSFGYEEALIFKIKLINKNKSMLYTFIIMFIILIFIHKIFLYPYDTSILELYNYHLLDVFLSIYFLFILRPQELPPNYNIDLGDNIEEDFGFIYKSFLPKYTEINNKKLDEFKNLQSSKDKNIPLIIIGPCLNNYKDEEGKFSINNYINNIEIGYKE